MNIHFPPQIVWVFLVLAVGFAIAIAAVLRARKRTCKPCPIPPDFRDRPILSRLTVSDPEAMTCLAPLVAEEGMPACMTDVYAAPVPVRAEERGWLRALHACSMKPQLTFDMRLRLLDAPAKAWYSMIKNAANAYGLHARMSRNRETFSRSRQVVARIAVCGKTLIVYLAIDPKTLDAAKYRHEDKSDCKEWRQVPTRIRVRSGYAARKVCKLLGEICIRHGWQRKQRTQTDYAAMLDATRYPYLARRGYARLLSNPATRVQASKLADSLVGRILQTVADKSSKSPTHEHKLTLAQIAATYPDGAVVDVRSAIGNGICPPDTDALYIAVSERLDKRYRVYADRYDADAVKMICMAGGEAYRVA